MIKDVIKFAKVKPEGIIPSKKSEDGCYDVYACFQEEFLEIAPHTIAMIPTGIASAFDKKYRVGLRERGSTGTKGMAYRAGQIDSGYRGEWFVPINNTTSRTIIILKGIKDVIKTPSSILYPYSKAVCQAALEYVPDVDVEEVSYEDLKAINSQRGETCLGQSGK